MFDLSDLFGNPDWSGKAKALLASLDTADPRFLLAVVAVFVFIGSKVVSSQPGLRRLGLRLGAATFLLYLGYAWYNGATFDGKELPGHLMRAANAGGLVLSLTWIIFPVLNFLYSHLRLALAAFLGYCGYAIVTTDNFTTEQLPDIAVRGLLAMALALVVAWIVHPIWDYFRDMLPRPKPRPVEEEETADPVAEERPERPRRERKATAPTVIETGLEVVSSQFSVMSPLEGEHQRRRDRARLQVEMLYVLAAPQIGACLPRAVFDEFLTRYLGDHLPPADVEENSRQLVLVLQQHQKQTQTAPTTFEDLARRLLGDQQLSESREVESRFRPNGLGSHPTHVPPGSELL